MGLALGYARKLTDSFPCSFCGKSVYVARGRSFECSDGLLHKGRCKRPVVRYLTREEIEKEYGEVDLPEELEERFDLAMSKDK